MIEKLELENFRAFRKAAIPLAPFTLIVGPNASGKTSILDAILYLSRIGLEPPQMQFQRRLAPEMIRTSGVEAPLRMGFSGQWTRTQGGIVLEWSAPVHSDAARRLAGFKCSGSWGKDPVRLDVVETGNSSTDGRTSGRYEFTQLLHPLQVAIRSSVLLHLDPNKLSEPGFVEDSPYRIEYDGANLTAELADMKLTKPSEFDELVRRLRTIVPSVKSVRFRREDFERVDYEPQGGGLLGGGFDITFKRKTLKYKGYMPLFDTLSGVDIVAPCVSEGTLLTLGVLYVLCGPSRRNLVLIDEIERGLHPKALGTLVAQIREIQKQFPELQVVATTHSPYLVDHFKPEEVVLTAIGEDGAAQAARLDQHPDFDKWKDEMKPGEFWSTVGEDWVLKTKTK